MEDLTLPSIGASFKKWGCCTHMPPSPRSPGPCYIEGPLNYFLKGGQKNKNKNSWPQLVRLRRVTASRWAAMGGDRRVGDRP
jgi:hypothetical protein